MNKIYSLILIVLVFTLSSCEDLFDKNPYNATSEDQVLTSEDEAQTLLLGVYTWFKSQGSYTGYVTNLPDIMTDAALASSGFTNSMGSMYAWNINPGSYEVKQVWKRAYTQIANGNYLLEGIDAVVENEDELNRMKGEALIGRAFLHYLLVKLYAPAYNSSTADSDLGVPYMLAPVNGEPTRNTVSEVYAYIIEDLSNAIELMDNSPMSDTPYFTAHFANGLLARIALDMKNYDDAIMYSDKVIQNSGCSLLQGDDFKDMWLNDIGNEIIWKVGYVDADFQGEYHSVGYHFYNRNDINNDKPQPDYIPADWLLELYDQENDIRYEAYYIETETDWGWTGTLVNKYPTNPIFDFQGRNMPKPMRLAEMYLIKAEAHAYKKEYDLARTELNTLLSSRINEYVEITLNGQDLVDFIFEERIRELAFEGFYWFDLKRNNLGFERTPQENTYTSNDLKIEADDFRWLWPIPTAELNGNGNIKQNNGY